MTQTTIIYSPHPDDETLRLSGYITYAESRGDRLILVATTDGGASNVKTTFGWTSQMLMDHRKLEQTHAWSALTKGRGTIIRLGIADGTVPANKATITSEVLRLEALYRPSGSVEHYVAAKDNDVHPDHVALVSAVRASGVPVVRVSTEPGTVGGTTYTCANVPGATLAYNGYRTIGWVSVPTLFQKLKEQNFSSHTTW